jgi:hypothetical protein
MTITAALLYKRKWHCNPKVQATLAGRCKPGPSIASRKIRPVGLHRVRSCSSRRSRGLSVQALMLSANKEPQDPLGTWGSLTLAMSYSRTTYRCTTIGAAAFHFRVRNGNGWCHCARITRRLVKPKLARGGRGRSRFNFTRNSSDLG